MVRKQQDTMEPLIEALKQATRAARNGWLFLLTLSVITIVTIASVSHTTLLINATVKLPVVQIGVPVATFFVFAPVFLLVVHAEVLIRHANLARRAKYIKEQFPEHQTQVFPSYHLVQIILEKAGLLHRQTYHWPHAITLLVLPLFVLLYAQSAYLPLHDLQITWLHRALAMVDATFLWLYVWSIWGGGKWQAVLSGAILLLPVLFFALAVATIPGEFIEKMICNVHAQSLCVPVPYGKNSISEVESRRAFWPTAWLFEGDINSATGRLNSLLARNLVIMNGDLAGSGKNKPRLNLRSRDLRYAILDGSNLTGVDFTASNMARIGLSGANLKGAVFGCANPGRAVPGLRQSPHKQSVKDKQICLNWWRAHEKQKCVNLSEADLSEADLTGSRIGGAMLRGANLSGAQMPKAVFSNGCLFTANMSGADLTGAEFRYTDLVGAAMRKTKLTGAVFTNSDLSLAELTGADLRCADFSQAAFLATDLSGAKIWRTVPPQYKEYFTFSALDKIALDKGKNACTNGDDATGKTELETWWEKSALHMHGSDSGRQDYVIYALCHNIEYLISYLKNIYIPKYVIYEEIGNIVFYGEKNNYEYNNNSRKQYNKELPESRIYSERGKIIAPPVIISKKIVINNRYDIFSRKIDSKINVEALWKLSQNGKCPAAKRLTDRQIRNLKQYAMWHKKKRKNKAKSARSNTQP